MRVRRGDKQQRGIPTYFRSLNQRLYVYCVGNRPLASPMYAQQLALLHTPQLRGPQSGHIGVLAGYSIDFDQQNFCRLQCTIAAVHLLLDLEEKRQAQSIDYRLQSVARLMTNYSSHLSSISFTRLPHDASYSPVHYSPQLGATLTACTAVLQSAPPVVLTDGLTKR